MSTNWDVIILGAGAAGLICAMTAARRGHSVLILEKSNKAGKKILMSGGGRCNFTNLHINAENFISHNPHFCKSALNRYTQWDFIDLVNHHGIAYHEKAHGQLFCDNSSKDILSMLLSECEQRKVSIKTQTDITEVTKSQRFKLVGKSENQIVNFQCDNLVVATGGLSIPSLGGSDFGYQVATQFGHRLLTRRAGLVPLTFTDNFKRLSDQLSGVSVPASIAVRQQKFHESILFSHRGLSGPAVLQISSYWREGDEISINLLPEINGAEFLVASKKTQPKISLRRLLSQHLPKSLILELETIWWPGQADKPLAEWRDLALQSLAQQLSGWHLKPAGTEGYRTAEVTLGGVDTSELSSKTMMSNKEAGLFFIGEVVDVSGQLGGYNFQWAWSSGYVAGLSV